MYEVLVLQRVNQSYWQKRMNPFSVKNGSDQILVNIIGTRLWRLKELSMKNTVAEIMPWLVNTSKNLF